MAEPTVQDSPDVSSVDSTALELYYHVFDVQSELIPVAANWRNIGIALRLKPDVLENINARYSGDPRACLSFMVMEWLKRNYDTRQFGEPTWRKLVEAVAHPAGGADKAVARKIARRHKAGVPRLVELPVTPSSPKKATFAHQECRAVVFARENRQAITNKFADFQTKVCSKLFKNGVDTEEFRLFVTNQFPPGDCIPPPPATMTEIFKAITYHGLWDFFHYSPLVGIAKKFGAGDPEIEDWVQTYMKDLKAYNLVTTVEEYIETDLEVADSLPAKKAKYDPHYYCPVEWKTNFVDHSLQYLTDVWELFSSHYLVPDCPPTALLDRVRKGCFSVTWLISSNLISPLIERAKHDTAFFKQHRIQRVTVGEECVYKEVITEEHADVPTNQGIIDKFATFWKIVFSKLLKSGVDVEDFRFFIVTIFPLGNVIPPPPTALAEIFTAITCHHLWDYFHYSPLERIVRKYFDGDPEMEALVQEYKSDLRSYNSKMKIIDYIEPKLDDHTTKYDLRYYCPVEWKITQSLADNTLNYLSYMWGMFSFHYFEPDPPSTSSLECVCKLEGSSSITWRVPSYLIPQLINKVKDDTRFFQKHHGILKVTVAGQCVYEQQAAIDNTLVCLEGATMQEYGRFPAVTLNNMNIVVAVRNSVKWFTLNSQVGVVSKEGDTPSSILWGQEDNYGSGYVPRVSLNNHNMIVEVHQSHRTLSVWYRVGKVDTDAKTIDWWRSERIGNGRAPAVSLTDSGHVVVVYRGFYRSYYRVGTIDTEHKKIEWAKEAQSYSSGQEHSVGMNDDGTVIEVHRSPSISLYRLRFTYGNLEVDNDGKISGSISWSAPETYSHGFYPYVSLNNDGKVVEVHQSIFFRRLSCQTGIANKEAKTLQLSRTQHHYGLGWAPVVALNDHNQVIEFHETNTAYKGNSLWYKISSLRDMVRV